MLVDECLPRRFARALAGHAVLTVAEAGWSGVVNGALLRLIEGRFDAFVTIDGNLEAQQTFANRTFGVVILHAQTNRIEDVRPLAPQVLSALASLRAGEVVHVRTGLEGVA